jgi:hypothetical protein
MPKEPLTENVQGVEYNRAELNALKDMFASDGWSQFKRLFEQWEVAGLLALAMGENLKVACGEIRRLGEIQSVPDQVDTAWENLQAAEEASAKA